MSLLIFTQLDEILFNLEESTSHSVTEAIALLQQQDIPLIPVGNRTRARAKAY